MNDFDGFDDNYHFICTIFDEHDHNEVAAQVGRYRPRKMVEVIARDAHIPLTDKEAMDLASALVRAVHG